MLSLLKWKKKDKIPARLRGNSCLNCNDSLDGNENFCPSCGQRNNINQLSFKLFVDEFFGDMFSYDSRLWGTVIPLILKPGKVAYEFVSGKRKEFVNPFRTYLTVSLIFFLVYGLLNTYDQYVNDGTNKKKATFVDFGSGVSDGIKDGLSPTEQDSIINVALAGVKKKTKVNVDSILKAEDVNLDSLKTDTISLDSIKDKARENSPFFKKMEDFYNYYKENKTHTTAQAFDSLGYENTIWNRFYYDKAQSSFHMIEDNAESFNEKIFSGASLAIFFMLPVLALALKLIYIRRKYTYMEHMVFVFYTQAVFFLLLLMFSIVYYVTSGQELLIFIPIGLFTLYLLFAMKKFYKQGWIKTFFKFVIANFTFMIISTIGFIVLVFISFIFY